MKHVVVTGGSGFVGSHLCEALLAKGYAVTALDNLVTGRVSNLKDAQKNPQFQFIEMDVSAPWEHRALQARVEALGVHGVLHFACPASPIDFDLIPFEILEVDSLGTMHSVDLALKHGARYLVASTSEVYGDPLEHPQKETYWGNVNSIGPRAVYDEAKRFAEAYVSAAIRGRGRYRGQKSFTPLNGAIVRIFNTYGPRMRLDDGRVVPELCRQALEGRPLTLHGGGTQSRSFCYVADLVNGILRLFESQVRDVVNIGNPSEFTILEFANVLEELVDQRLERQVLPGREDDPRRRRPDISRAREWLGWEPKTNLRDGLSLTINAFRAELGSSS